MFHCRQGGYNPRRGSLARQSVAGGQAVFITPCEEVKQVDEDQAADVFNGAAWRAVELGNQLAAEDESADVWDIADGLLAGAVQYWLYSREPCGDPRCEDCAPNSTAEQRLAELLRLTRQFAQESDYFHTRNDSNVGSA